MGRGKTAALFLLCLSFALALSLTSAVACSTLTITDNGGPSPSPPYDPLIVTVNSTDYKASQLPAAPNYPNNNPIIAYQFYDRIAGASPGSRYVWTRTDFTYESSPVPQQKPIADTFALPSSGWWRLEAFYKLQYQVTFTAASGGTTSPAAGEYWYEPGSSVPISAAPAGSYHFVQWAVTGGISVADQFNPTTTMTVAGSGTVQAVFTQPFQPVSFSMAGVGTDAIGTVLTLGGTPYARDAFNFSLDLLEGSSYVFSWAGTVSAGAQKRYAWTAASGLSTSMSGSITIPAAPATLAASYRAQYYLTIGAGAGGSVNASSGWYDEQGVTVITATPSAGYKFKNWTATGGVSVANPNLPTTAMTAAGAGTLQAYFELLPVAITFAQSGIGTDFTGAVLNVDGAPVTGGELAKSYDWAVGSDHTFSWLSPLTVTAEKRYMWTATAGLSNAQSGTITVPSSPGSVTASYKTQYYVAIGAGIGGTVDRGSDWYDASSLVTVTATPSAGYSFKNWTATGGVSVSDPGSPTAAVTVAGAGSLQANFELLPVGVTFMQSGVGADFSGTVVRVDSVNVSRSELPKTYSWPIGSSHTYEWQSPLAVSPDKRYVWASTTGLSTAQSGSIVVPSATAYLSGNYVTQYSVGITAGNGGAVNATGGWYNSSSTVVLMATPGAGYAFKGWAVSGGVSASNTSSPTASFTISGAGAIQAMFELQSFIVVFAQSGVGPDYAGTVVSVDSAGLSLPELARSYSWTYGSNHTFAWLSPLAVSGSKQYVWVSSAGLTTLQGGSINVTSAGYVNGSYRAQYYITITAGAGGTVSATSGWHDESEAFAVTATPASGYRFKGWVATGNVSISDAGSPTATVTANGAGSVQATFELLPVGVSFIQYGVGADFSGAVSIVDGAELLRAELPKVFSWSVGSAHSFSWLSPLNVSTVKRYVWVSTSGLSSLQSGPLTAPSGSSAVTGTYAAEFYVSIGASTGGTARLAPGGWFREGQTAIVSADPSPDYAFLGWTATGGVTVHDPDARSTAFTVSGPGSVTANFIFVPPTFNVTFASSAGGSVEPYGSWSYDLGEVVPIAASASPGYEFLGWVVDGEASVADPASQSTLLTVLGHATVTARFAVVEVPTFTVIFSSNNGGTVSPDGSNNYSEGMTVDIAAVPDGGHYFSTWNVTGGVVIADAKSPATTITVFGHGTVTAHFHVIGSDRPVVEEVFPPNGSIVDGRSIKIRASFADGLAIDPSSVVLRVDGVEVSGAEVTEGGVAYETTLQPGVHTVELMVRDMEGNPRTATWKVVADPVAAALSWELFAVIAAEIVAAGLIVFFWLKRRGAVPKAPSPPKKPIVR